MRNGELVQRRHHRMSFGFLIRRRRSSRLQWPNMMTWRQRSACGRQLLLSFRSFSRKRILT
ncbi:hypothetical protein X992_5476 [Burkholderia pseudomallei MSHR5492]|nr:hypothetical protein X992_5476 [Burkholderia pseudomallei MSHR5492]